MPKVAMPKVAMPKVAGQVVPSCLHQWMPAPMHAFTYGVWLGAWLRPIHGDRRHM